MQIPRQISLIVLICSLSCLYSPLSRSQEISIEYATGRDRDAMYLVDVNLALQLDEEILTALRHGVSLEIDVELEIRRERKWIWNKLLKQATLRYQLEHHPLSDDYVVTYINENTREQFQTVDEALHYLGSIKSYPIIEMDRISGEETYLGFARAELNIEELPPPLKPIAYVSSEWHLESQWYEWIIR